MKKIVLSLVVGLTAMTTAKSQITAGLEAQYPLDGSITDAYNSNDLTSNGTLLYGDNRLNQTTKSFAFDGNTILTAPLDLSAMASKSVSLWFITDSPGGLIGHEDGGGGYAPIMYIGTDGKLKGKFWDGGQGSVSNSNQILTDSLWHHVVITASSAGQKVYLDNNLVGSTSSAVSTISLPVTSIGYVVATGWPSAPNNASFNGGIDDVRIYSTVIDATIVDSLYNTPVWTPPVYPYELDTLYVDQNATGANDGSSWADAYTDAREAFVNTTENAEIWIAQGTYIRNATDRNSVFGWTKDSIRVYGGFVGNETERNQRDWNANPTIFSGDMGISGDSTDNAYTVFVGPLGDLNYALIDGIKITGGNADVDSYPNFNTVGGGMTIDTQIDLFDIKNVEFYGNYAKQGGAISAYGSGQDCKINLDHVVAHHNIGRSSAFGHFRASSVSKLTLEINNCLIYENHALESLPNQTQDFGTVLFLAGNANIANVMDATITNSTFANNTYESLHKSKGMIRVFNQTNAPSVLEFTNNICYGNNIVDITVNNHSNASNPFPTINLNNNILENGIDFTATTENSTLTSDPLFNSDYTLQAGSPAIDAGTQSGITASLVDLAGNNRIFGAEIDLGAYEYTVQTANISALQEEHNITMYPNPTNGLVNIKSSGAIKKVSVINQLGQEIETFTEAQFSINHLPTGLYIVKVQTDQGTAIQKLIKK